MARYQHTTGFTRGEVDESLYDRVDVDFYRAASKHMENWFPDLAGSIKRRPPILQYHPHLDDLEHEDQLLKSFSFMGYDILIRFAYYKDNGTPKLRILTYLVDQEHGGDITVKDNKEIEIEEPDISLSRKINLTSVGPSAFITSHLFPPYRVFYDLSSGDVGIEEIQWYQELVGSVTKQRFEEYERIGEDITYQVGDMGRHDNSLWRCDRPHYASEGFDSDNWANVSDIGESRQILYGEDTLFNTQLEDGDTLLIRGEEYEIDEVLTFAHVKLTSNVGGESFSGVRIAKKIDNPFGDDYPALCTFHRGRLFLFSTRSNPVKMWASKPGDPFIILPGSTHDDAPIEYELLAEGADEFKWVATGEDIYLGGSRAEYIVVAPGESPLTPTNFTFTKIADLGGDSTPPVTSDASIMFLSRSRTQLFAVAYDFQRAGFTSNDVSLLAPHLIKKKVRELAFRPSTRMDRAPRIILILDDGTVRTVAISEEQNVIAWSRISFTDEVEILSVAATASDFYFLVRDKDDNRTYIAILGKDEEPYFTMDLQRTYTLDSEQKTSVSYIHDSRTVAVVSKQRGFLGFKTLSGSTLDLSDEEEGIENTDVVVGISYVSRLELLPTIFEAHGGAMLNRKRRMIRALVSVRDAYQLYVNDEPLFGILAERLGRELAPQTGVFEKRMLGWYTQDKVTIESASIYRATILSVTREVNA